MQIIHLFGMTFVITFIGVAQSRECTFIDVRNRPSELKRLEGCTAVLGFLQIMLIDHATPEDFEQYSFPELREVTGFFMLYRVFGLLSVRRLFPNLSIIRGNELLMNYALIMHEMMNITEVGLPSLQTISRGNARIQRCPNICDADTFNWQKITNSSSNFFYDYGQRCTGIPKRVYGPSRRICNLARNQTECFVPVETKPKEIPLNQCHELCLIGCHNATARGCYACKGPRDAGVCVDKCPDSKIYDESYMRCLTRAQCRSYNKFIFEEKLLCVSMCPKGYIEQDSKNNYEESYDHKCYPCEGLVCPKVCLAADINYVEDAYKLHGCQIISGSIHININIAADRPELMDELTKYLGSIEEIYGFLKIYRSYPITSLDFLKNLRVIHGTELQNDYFALFVYDNNNLQGLWKPHPNFEILKGSVLFSSNDKLCPYVVQEFLDEIGQNATKVNLESNGGRSFCNSTIIDVKAKVLSPTKVTIFWEAFTAAKDEGLVGYLINYVESMDTNVTHFYGTYSCTVTAWNTQSVKTSDAIRTDNNYLSFNLTHLSSLTQYAFYVRTNFEGSNYRKQGQSPIRYFKTPVHTLMPVFNLRTFAKASTSITLQWNVIPKEREHISFYSVDILQQPDDQVIYSRDFCQNPQENSAYEELQVMQPGNEACCCGADKAEDNEAQDVSMEEDEIEVEDIEIADVKKYKYYVSSTSFMPNQTNGNRYEITGLKPYTLYSFQFFACMTATICSAYTLHSDRTRPDSSADMVLVNVHQDGERNETITAEFDVKNETNGAVVGYVIQEKRKEEENVYVTDSKCFSLVQNSLWNHTFSLPAGVIQLRFQAITLAGLGPFTDWYNITVLEIPEPPNVVGNFFGALFFSLFIFGSVYGTIWFKQNRHRICKQKPPVDRNEMEMLVFGVQNPNVDDELLMDEIPLGNVHFEEADFY